MSEKKYFTYFNKEEAREYIGKKCRFSNDPTCLETRQSMAGILKNVEERASYPFSDDHSGSYMFCSPIEKKLRPYNNFEEMAKDAFKHGYNCETFKIIGKNECMHGVSLLPDGAVVYHYTGTEDDFISFEKLAEKYIWLDGTPCGVEEEV